MTLPNPFPVDPTKPKPPDPPIPPEPVEPPPPEPPELTQRRAGLTSLLYVNPPPPSPAPDASRGGVVVFDRTELRLTDIFEMLPDAPAVLSSDPGVEAMEWGGTDRAKPQPPPTIFPWTCPECQVGHWESAVIEQQQYTTTMMAISFYDKTNIYHVHDPNIRTTWYVCTRGHRWTIQQHLVCPAVSCVWPAVI